MGDDTAPRLARVAAYGMAGTAMAGVFAMGVLLGQAALAHRTIPRAEAPPPRGDRRYGNGNRRRPLTLVMLGDSSAAGYGTSKPRQAPGALLATGLAARLHRPVQLRNLAVVGATSAMLAPQVEAALQRRPDVAVILVGGNDVTHWISPAAAVPHLVHAVRTLREAGAKVVVGTCPDLGTIKPIRPPLRWLAHRWSRQMAAAQTIAVVEAGGATVSLGDLLGPRFAADPRRMFALDGFHPSVDGYAAAAAAILPSLVAVLSDEGGPAQGHDEGVIRPPADTAMRGSRSSDRPAEVKPLAQAAAEAAETAGTEVTGARVAGREHGPGGRWALLRRRVPSA